MTSRKTKADLEAEVEQLTKENDRLQRRLEKQNGQGGDDTFQRLLPYVSHKPDCPRHHVPPSVCDCGLEQVLVALHVPTF